ncbi:MAG TPA: PAS domain-containing protein [Candidatus Angelobacter sp.]|nr:PAS domain-containing protein [Candidatus Angelobacter sp.]
MRPPDPDSGKDSTLQAPVAQLEREVAELRRQLATLMPQPPGQQFPLSEAQQVFHSEAGYRALIELFPQVVWISDPEGRATYANQYWYELTGFTLEQTLNGGWTRAIHPDDAERTYIEWQKVAARGTPWECEYRLRRASDGQYRWHACRAVALRDASGSIARWIGIALDIHDRKTAMELLAEADERLRLAVEAANIGAWDHYLHTDQVQWSPRAREIFGFDGQGQPSFNWFFSHIHPEDRPRVVEKLKCAADPAIRSDYDADYRFTMADGTFRWVLARGKVFFDGEGDAARAIRTAGMVVDITDRKQAEWERAMLTATLQHSPDFIGITDLKGKIVFLNKAGQKLVGLRDDAEAESKTVYDFLPPRELEVLREEILPAVQRHGVWEGRFSLRHFVTGEPIPFDTRGFGIFDAAGKLTNIATVSRDIAEKEKLEEQLRMAQKMEAIGRLAAGIAHDFNNLLTVVRGSAEVLEQRLPQSADDLHHRLREITGAADRASALTEQLLTFGRRQMVFPQVINLNHVVLGMDDMLRRLVGEDITLSVSLAPDLWNVRMNPSQADQILINFAANARDAMPAGGNISVKTWNQILDGAPAQAEGLHAGEYVCMAVTDNGAGMDAETLTHIFEPFFTTKEMGTGMGLATVYGIVQQCSGQVTARCSADTGTEFIVYLPRTTEAPMLDPALAKDPNLPAELQTILIVEDEPSLRALLADYVRESGYRVLEAASATEAIEVVRSQRLDLLVTDIVMPGGSGQDLACTLSLSHGGLGIIFMSGYADNVALQEAASQPGVFFVPKPFTLKHMLKKIREALGGCPQTPSTG